MEMNNGYSTSQRDLLQRFREGNQNPRDFELTKEEEEEEIELNLGLSLGGCFGVDPKKENNNRLFRSSSIGGLATTTTTTLYRDDDDLSSTVPLPQPFSFPLSGGGGGGGINRTCSLPTETETEEEWRKRKEMQCLRRMEARRKRFHKQMNGGGGGGGGGGRIGGISHPVEEGEEESGRRRVMNVRVKIEGGTGLTSYPVGGNVKQEAANGFSASSVTPSNGLPFWAALSRGGGGGGAAATTTGGGAFRGGGGGGGGGGLPPLSPPGSQGSSGISEFETKPVQGLNNCTEARSPSSVHSLTEHCEQRSSTNTENSGLLINKIEVENPSKKPKIEISNTGSAREMGMKVMDDMPCVSTRAVGPNGRRIEGFLYKYRKGEEVRIVCVCHGSCLSPAEFVKHGGGGDVTHPLRHIVVSPSPSFL